MSMLHVAAIVFLLLLQICQFCGYVCMMVWYVLQMPLCRHYKSCQKIERKRMVHAWSACHYRQTASLPPSAPSAPFLYHTAGQCQRRSERRFSSCPSIRSSERQRRLLASAARPSKQPTKRDGCLLGHAVKDVQFFFTMSSCCHMPIPGLTNQRPGAAAMLPFECCRPARRNAKTASKQGKRRQFLPFPAPCQAMILSFSFLLRHNDVTRGFSCLFPAVSVHVCHVFLLFQEG